jgi:hypothetical protein
MTPRPRIIESDDAPVPDAQVPRPDAPEFASGTPNLGTWLGSMRGYPLRSRAVIAAEPLFLCESDIAN